MLQDFARSLIINQLGFEPTPGQERAVGLLSEFLIDNTEGRIFILNGYAGTGKTTLVSALINALAELNLNSVLMAPTGRAAKVLARYSGKQAFTIHKKIYRQKSSTQEMFMLDVNLLSNTLFIVDEASMIPDGVMDGSLFGSGRLLADLITYVYNDKRCSLILVGDVAQLPPVGLDLSPALDPSYVERTFLRPTICATLTDVVRQGLLSGILHNATGFRNYITAGAACTPTIETKQFTDICPITGSDLIDLISSSYDKKGIDETMIITRSNKRANRYNQGIRKSVLFKEEEISTGDYIMVVKNNYFDLEKEERISFIANGDVAKIVKIRRYHELYGLRFADVTLQFIDYDNIELDRRIVLDTLSSETASMTGDQMKLFAEKVMEDFPEVKNKKDRVKILRESQFFNALQVKFAYAVTCHKAQGGQWENVFVDHDYLPETTLSVEYLRWLYTAFTRASSTLYLVNFKEEFLAK